MIFHLSTVVKKPSKMRIFLNCMVLELIWPLCSVDAIKRLYQLFETLCFKKRQKLGILWPNIAKIGASGKSQAARASSWFFSWFTWATELLVLAFLMKILSVFGDFWDEPIKNDQKNLITDLLGYEKSHASNTSESDNKT